MADRPDPEMHAATEAAPVAKPRRSWRTIALMLLVPLLIALVGGYFWLTSGRFVSTDNAYVQHDMVSVSPDVAGRIVEVNVAENEFVEAGTILFTIDPDPYRIAVQQADAAIAEAELALTQAQTTAATGGVDITAAQQDIAFAEANLRREQALMTRGFNTRARIDAAQHEVSEARGRLRNAIADQQNARAALGRNGSAAYPAIAAARARRADAALDLERTVVRAPVSGIVSQTQRLQVGQMAAAGLPALSIVSSEQAWIEANFKETDLARMRVGQPARVTFDAYPDLVVRGHVESIGAGTGSEFSLLPAQNATGNWVKVTQRVPVRIALDEVPARDMIAGLSAHVRIDIRDDGER